MRVPQMALNMAASLVLKYKRSRRTSLILEQLHWLPIEKSIYEKMLAVACKARNGSAPTYQAELLK